ncbi:MAG: peptidase S8, partial [Bacteroidetes bacterium]|nr:peptidase S8 [Bacteroidota bacterium]
MKHFYLIVIGLVLSTFSASAQTDIPKGWHLLDVKQDSFYGISLNKAYQFLQAKKIKSTSVTVSVLDSGVDTLQEDLQPILWHNPKEIPNNNIDEDKNGYVDDYYGWNFLGNKNGESLVTTTKETVRFYHQYKDEFGGKQIDTLKLSAKEKYRYQVWKQAAEDLNISTDKELELSLTLMALKSIKNCDSILRNEMNVEEYTAAQLEKYEPKTNESKRSKLNYITTLQILQIDLDEKNTSIINQLEEYIT